MQEEQMRWLFFALLVLLPGRSVWGEDWPQWRGPNRDGVWHTQGIAAELPDGQLPLEWSVEVGAGYSGPTVAAGRVYVMDRMFNERGELLITKLSPTGLQIIDRCQLIEPTKVQLNQRGGVCWTHPAFAEQSIFARNDERIVRASLAK